MNALKRLKLAATTFNYTKKVSSDEFDALVLQIQAAAWNKGFIDLHEWENGYADEYPTNPYGDA